jgi:hypothetical protein
VFAPTDHVFTLSHKAFACLAKENRLGTVIALHLPNQRRRPSPVSRRQRKGFMSLRTTRMTIHNRRTVPIRQMMFTILGGTAVTFAMILGFVNPSWALQVSPSALTFSTTSGGTDPSPQIVVLSTNRSRERTWAATVNAPWITITPSSGTITTETDTVSVRTTAAGLAAGSYSAGVTITETSQSGRIRRTFLPVTLSITGAAATSAIQLSVSNLAFSGTAGGANPAAKTIGVSNSGGGTLSWTASDNATWLTLSPLSGTNSGTVTTSVNLTGLAAGTYNAIVTVAASGSTNTPQQIPVSLTLSVTAASTATLSWNANTESDLAGYKVYQGTGSGTYGAPLTTLPKTTTSYTATGLQNGTTYFFVITSYDSSGNESTFSNEVSKSIF